MLQLHIVVEASHRPGMTKKQESLGATSPTFQLVKGAGVRVRHRRSTAAQTDQRFTKWSQTSGHQADWTALSMAGARFYAASMDEVRKNRRTAT